MNQPATMNANDLATLTAPAGFQYGTTSKWLAEKFDTELVMTAYKAFNGAQSGLKGACWHLSRPKVKAKEGAGFIATALAYRSVLYTVGMPLNLIHTVMNENLTPKEVERLPVEIY